MSGLTRDEPKEIAQCAYCQREICVGDTVKRIDGEAIYVHDGWNDICAQEYAMERVYDAEGTINAAGEIE